MHQNPLLSKRSTGDPVGDATDDDDDHVCALRAYMRPTTTCSRLKTVQQSVTSVGNIARHWRRHVRQASKGGHSLCTLSAIDDNIHSHNYRRPELQADIGCSVPAAAAAGLSNTPTRRPGPVCTVRLRAGALRCCGLGIICGAGSGTRARGDKSKGGREGGRRKEEEGEGHPVLEAPMGLWQRHSMRQQLER